MTGRFTLVACGLLGIALGGAGCQTLLLDDSSPDGGRAGTGGTSGVIPSDASVDGRCFGNQQQSISFQPSDPPQVIVVLDDSTGANMIDPTFGSSEFLTAASDLSAVVSQYQMNSGSGHGGGIAMSFYYLAFPGSSNNCSAELGCCSSGVTATPDSTSFQAVAYACNMSGTGCVSSARRPIGAALFTAAQAFVQPNLVQSGPRFVLLVTGGSPPEVPDCFTPSDCQYAINAVDKLQNPDTVNATTYIIGMGDQTNTDCLQAMATDEGSSQYYSAAQASGDLGKTLGMVTGQIAQAACHVTLLAPITSSGQIMVNYQGTAVGPGFPDGWTLDTDTSTPRLFLHGSACTNYLRDSFGLEVSYVGCSASRP